MTPAVAQAAGPEALLSMDDYPKEAVQRGEQGTVRTRLRISREGRVIGCTILQSATPTLDAATCRVLTERARFVPSKKEGVAIESDFDSPPIRWQLAKPDPKPKPNSQRVRL